MAQIWRDSTGVIKSSVSATGVIAASKFVGDGSGLTSVSAVDPTKLPLSGGNMTGQLTLAGSTLTVTGNTFSVGGSTFVVRNGNILLGSEAPVLGYSPGNPILTTINSLAGAVDQQHTYTIESYDSQPLAAGNGGGITFGYVLDNAGPVFAVGGGIRAIKENATAGNFRGNLVFSTRDSVMGERMRINYIGNVGIGTTAPGAKLDVAGDITAARYQINGSTVMAILPGGSLGIGVNAGRINTHDFNVFIGSAAGYSTSGAGAVSNNFVGYMAGYNNSSGNQNNFIGREAGKTNTTGGNNTFVGNSAGYGNNTGMENSYLGDNAGYSNAAGRQNVALGASAGAAGGSSYSSSTLVGYGAGGGITSGIGNTLLGYKAGDNLATGGNNIIIGNNQDATASTISDELNIGGLLRGNLNTGTIGIGFVNTIPLAALDVKSTGTAANVYAQIWRNGGGTVVASMTSQGTLYATLPPGAGDNLGNHTAAANLQMNTFNILNASTVSAKAMAIGDGVAVGSSVSLLVRPLSTVYDYVLFVTTGYYATAGTLVVSSTGYVGIGTTGPKGLLQIGEDGVIISSGGAIQTTGVGHGTVVGNARGVGATDLQTSRWSANRVASGAFSVIGGGQENVSSSDHAVVAGGASNTASNYLATVAGGHTNTAGGIGSTVSGGRVNRALGDDSAVGGGKENTASGIYSVVPGGYNNSAIGSYSFAGGWGSSSTASGAFTWADSVGNTVLNNVTDQVMFKARGGFLVSTSTLRATPGLYVSPFNTVGIGTVTSTGDITLHVNKGNSANKFLLGDEAGKGLLMRDTGSSIDIESYGAPIMFNANTGQNVYFYQGNVGFGVTTGLTGSKVAISQTNDAEPYVLKVGTGTYPTMLTVSTSGVVNISGVVRLAKDLAQSADTGITLGVSDFGKTITVNNAAAQTVTLPSVGAGDIGAQFTIVKLGTGKVVIDAPVGAFIADSTDGGTIYNNAVTPPYASLTLKLVTPTLWMLVGGEGSWITN
jgi:hypothetical protein